MRHARRLIPASMNAEIAPSDIVQEAFLDAQRHAEVMPSKDTDQLRAWLYRILVLNLAERKRRVMRRRQFKFLDPPGTGAGWQQVADERPTPRTTTSRKERRDRLVQAIEKLPDVDRQVIRWRYWDRLDFAEIGRRLGGRSDDAARKLHVRACKKLYAILGDGFS